MCLLGCLQGSSVGVVNAVQPASSNAASADSMMSNKTEPILCFTEKQGHSSLSFSGLNVESSAADYQDCGASSMLLMGEPPWCPPCPESPFSSANRSDAVMRYKEKKKTRMWVCCQSKIYLVYSLGLPPFFVIPKRKLVLILCGLSHFISQKIWLCYWLVGFSYQVVHVYYIL